MRAPAISTTASAIGGPPLPSTIVPPTIAVTAPGTCACAAGCGSASASPASVSAIETVQRIIGCLVLSAPASFRHLLLDLSDRVVDADLEDDLADLFRGGTRI